jgi:hypothetical protein
MDVVPPQSGDFTDAKPGADGYKNHQSNTAPGLQKQIVELLWRNVMEMERWMVAEWRQHLAAGESPSRLATLRQYTHTGRPLGSEKFVADLEHSTLRALTPRKAGRPKNHVLDAQQDNFTFAA